MAKPRATSARVIFDVDRAVALLGGNAEDARVQVQDALALGRTDLRSLANAFENGRTVPDIRPHALLDYRDRAMVNMVLCRGPAAKVAAKALTEEVRPPPEIHLEELTRWARATGASNAFAPDRQKVASKQARREEALRRLNADTPKGSLCTRKEWQEALTRYDRALFPIEMPLSTFEDFWQVQKVVKLSR